MPASGTATVDGSPIGRAAEALYTCPAACIVSTRHAMLKSVR